MLGGGGFVSSYITPPAQFDANDLIAGPNITIVVSPGPPETATISAIPSGSDTEIQYNSNGAFAGSPALTWDNTNSIFNVNGTYYLNGAPMPVVPSPVGVSNGMILTIDSSAPSGMAWLANTPGTGGPGGQEREVPAGAIDGVNVMFTLSQQPIPQSVLVVLNGVVQLPGTDYTILNAVITFTVPPQPGDWLEVWYAVPVSGGGGGGQGQTPWEQDIDGANFQLNSVAAIGINGVVSSSPTLTNLYINSAFSAGMVIQNTDSADNGWMLLANDTGAGLSIGMGGTTAAAPLTGMGFITSPSSLLLGAGMANQIVWITPALAGAAVPGAVGLSNANPAWKLDVAGDVNITDAGGAGFAFRYNGVAIPTGNAVTSVFGRTGAVVAQTGDYSAAMVLNAVDATQGYANPPWITQLAWSKISGAPAWSQTPWTSSQDAANFVLNNLGGAGIGQATAAVAADALHIMSFAAQTYQNALNFIQAVVTANAQIRLQNDAGNAFVIGQFASAHPVAPNMAVLSWANTPLVWVQSNVERLRMTNLGQLGLGIPNPAYLLDVAGDVNVAAGSVYRIGGVPLTFPPSVAGAADGEVLMVDSSAPGGLVWAPVGAGGEDQSPWLSDIDAANFNLINARSIAIGAASASTRSLYVLTTGVNQSVQIQDMSTTTNAGLIVMNNQSRSIVVGTGGSAGPPIRANHGYISSLYGLALSAMSGVLYLAPDSSVLVNAYWSEANNQWQYFGGRSALRIFCNDTGGFGSDIYTAPRGTGPDLPVNFGAVPAIHFADNSTIGIYNASPQFLLDVGGDVNIAAGSVYRIGGVPLALGGSPGGANTQVQWNNNGAFGASANFTWNDSVGLLTLQTSGSNGGMTYVDLAPSNIPSGTNIGFTKPAFSSNAISVLQMICSDVGQVWLSVIMQPDGGGSAFEVARFRGASGGTALSVTGGGSFLSTGAVTALRIQDNSPTALGDVRIYGDYNPNVYLQLGVSHSQNTPIPGIGNNLVYVRSAQGSLMLAAGSNVWQFSSNTQVIFPTGATADTTTQLIVGGIPGASFSLRTAWSISIDGSFGATASGASLNINCTGNGSPAGYYYRNNGCALSLTTYNGGSSAGTIGSLFFFPSGTGNSFAGGSVPSIAVNGNQTVCMQTVAISGTGYGFNGGSYYLQITGADSAAKPSTNTWTVPSDIRTKRNVRRFDGDIEVIRKLDPIVAEYNGLGNTPEGLRVVSFDAAELQKIIPQCVTVAQARMHADDAEMTDVLGVNIHEILFHMLRVVQQLDKRLQEIEAN